MEELIRALNAAGDGAFIVDSGQRITYWNQAAQEILGFSSDQAAGLHCYRLLRGYDRQEQPLCVQSCWVVLAAFSGASVRSFDMRVFTQGRSERLINVSILTLPPTESDEGPRVLHLFRDISHREKDREKIGRILDIVEKLHERRPIHSRAWTAAGDEGASLTQRERQVLDHLARGLGTAEIANELILSESTVRNYIQRILNKLQVHSRLEAVVYAYRNGIVDDSE